MKKIYFGLMEFLARRRLKKSVFVGKLSKISFRKISAKKNCRVSVGTQTFMDASISFDKEDAAVSIGDRCYIGGANFVCAVGITIGSDVQLAWGTTIVDHNSHSVLWEERKNDAVALLDGKKDWAHVKMAPVRICDKAWIGFNSIILKGVTVGEGAVVGAGSVVTKDVPPYTVVAGNPAKVIREIKN